MMAALGLPRRSDCIYILFFLFWLDRAFDFSLIRVRGTEYCGFESTNGEQWRWSLRRLLKVRKIIACEIVSIR